MGRNPGPGPQPLFAQAFGNHPFVHFCFPSTGQQTAFKPYQCSRNDDLLSCKCGCKMVHTKATTYPLLVLLPHGQHKLPAGPFCFPAQSKSGAHFVHRLSVECGKVVFLHPKGGGQDIPDAMVGFHGGISPTR